MAHHPQGAKTVFPFSREKAITVQKPEPSETDSLLQELLEEASARTEEKFLFLGSRLNDFQGRAKAVARQAEDISGLLLGRNTAETVSGLQTLVQGLGRQRQQMQTTTETDRQTLEAIARLLEKLHTPLSGFRKIIKTLLSLGIATRIESSQSDRSDAGFMVFADDLKELSALIDSRSSHVLNQLGELHRQCRSAWGKLAEGQSGQQEKAQLLLKRAGAALAQMDARTHKASGKADAIFSRLADFTGHIGEIVASIQFQDIIRQKIMHVQHALDDLKKARLEGSAAAEIYALQSAQLQHARTEMNQAVGKITENLHSLAGQIARTAEQTREVAGAADSTDITVFREFEKVISGISLLLQEGEMIRLEATSAVGTVADAVRNMAVLLEEIEYLGEKMKVVALNAGIRAAHVGEKGAALGVIAESIQQLSQEALILTRNLGSGFREVIESARSLGDGAEICAENPGALLQQATALLEQLQEINARQVCQLREMDETAAELAEDLLQVSVSTDVHLLFSQDIENILDILQASAAATGGTGAEEQHSSALFQDLMARYTMHSEREIHQTKKYTAPESKVIHLPRRPSGIQHDLGENVELF